MLDPSFFEQIGILVKGRNSTYPRESNILCEWRLEEKTNLEIVLWFVGEIEGFPGQSGLFPPQED